MEVAIQFIIAPEKIIGKNLLKYAKLTSIFIKKN